MRGHWWMTGPALLLIAGGLAWFGVRAWGPALLDGRWQGALPLGSPARPDPEPGPEPSWDAIFDASQAQQWHRVESLLRDRIGRRDDDGRARLMLARLLASSNRQGEAARTLAGVPQDDPAFAEARTSLGEIALAASDAPRAELAFRQAAAADPAAVAPRDRLIYLLSLQLRPAEARAILWEIHRAQDAPRVLADLVLDAFRPEMDVRGIPPEIHRFLDHSPDDPFLRRAVGLALHWRGDASAALPHLEAAASALLDDPIGRFALAECRVQLGLPVNLPEILGPTPDPPADAARWHLFLGQLQEADGRRDDALDSVRRAVALNHESAEAHHRLAQLLAPLGDPEADAHTRMAEQIRARWLRLRDACNALIRDRMPPDPARFSRLGDLCRDASLLAEARAWYEHALAIDPAFQAARDALAALDERDAPFPVPRSFPRRSAPDPSAAPGPNPRPAADDRPPVVFEDIAASAGIAYQYNFGPQESVYLADTIGGGVGLIDADGDGLLDIYFVNGCPMPYDRAAPPTPNRLYRNLGDGRFEDVTEHAGVGGLGYGMGCAVGDFDGDGFDDLFVTGLDRTILYRNLGDGRFEDVTEAAGVSSDRWTTAAGFADLDGDGDLDLVVVSYVEDDSDDPRRCLDPTGHPIHCSLIQYPAQQDHLFRNDGDGTFTDVSEAAGITAPDGRGLGLAIADLDGDGLLDLFVANDMSPDFLYRNLGGLRFEEVGAASGLALDGSGRATASMGVVAEDLSGDGRIDLFHTNFLNEPNTLARNLGGGQFADGTLSAGLAAPSVASTGFGAVALDADNDGRLDLFVSNGHVDDQPHYNAPMPQRPHLYLGRDGNRFILADSDAFPYLSRAVVGRGVAAGDLDNDGRVDLVVVHRDAPASVLMNRTEGGHRVGFRLVGPGGNRLPVGTRIAIEAGGRRQVRWLTSGTSYLASNDPRLWFGLGADPQVDRVDIRWPSGVEHTLRGLTADAIYVIQEDVEPGSNPTRSRPLASSPPSAITADRQWRENPNDAK
ncbi:FG-GAP-like repeat-containing protein [Tautonia sp. JC769]|uniref:FG-GAP-like repeat-containing protein n=1 Tax=Tautonia sp. JC769 TaxID=3232135 RepID=UPI00345A0075